MRPKSSDIFSQSCTTIPGGVNSPARSFKGVDVSPPLIVESGQADTIYDVDGHSYIDYCCSWGALILGHAHPKVVTAAQKQMQKGSSFGIATPIENEMAQKVTKLMPNIEKIRFVSSGTEATMTAIRLARGFSGKSKIIKFAGHYHGHADPFLIQAGSGVTNINAASTSKGVPTNVITDTICLPFNDTLTLRSFFMNDPRASDIAAIILEPIAGNMGVVLPEIGFLDLLEKEARQAGALLIFDEVMTGFRVGLQGAQGLYKISPDLSCLGKVVGGGFPAAAVGGKKKIMDCLAPIGEVYQAGTLSGNPVAMQAGFATLSIIEEPLFFENLNLKANRLTQPILEIIKKRNIHASLQQCGSMFSIFFGVTKVKSKEDLKSIDQKKFNQFFRYLFERGIYIPPSAEEAWFVSSAHTDEHLDYTLNCILDFLKTHK